MRLTESFTDSQRLQKTIIFNFRTNAVRFLLLWLFMSGYELIDLDEGKNKKSGHKRNSSQRVTRNLSHASVAELAAANNRLLIPVLVCG